MSVAARSETSMSSPLNVEPGDGRTILLVIAHADDAALFLGGTLIRWTDAGWNVVCVRVTDDRWDSVGLSEAEAIAANERQFQAAAKVLGIRTLVELGYPTDVLGDVSEVALREKIIRLVRTHRPYALVSFDPYAMYGEDNQDHVKVAAAVDESFWTSQFDLHHPEHLREGLDVHGCFERWYFGRSVMNVTDILEISSVLQRKIDAVACHEAAMRNYVNQLRLQARTGGWDLPGLDDIAAGADLRPFLEHSVTERARRIGAKHGLTAAEEFRVVRFGGQQGLLEKYGRRRHQSQGGKP